MIYLCAMTSKYRVMATSRDFMKLWEKYQELIKVKDVSIVDYCQRNGIVYSQFEKWYKKNTNGVSLVALAPPSSSSLPSEGSMLSRLPVQDSSSPLCQVLRLEIEFSNGMTVIQKCIDYDTLRNLVEKLEVLC